MQILETTLRDGSYSIDFRFTAHDTEILCKEFENAGFRLIEIGHGIGLGASEAGKGVAAETDEEYMRAASKALDTAKWGMFCIPGIAKLEHIDMAHSYGMGFIRIGTNVTEVETSEKYISRAKKYGMFVSANFMKSYAMEPERFAEKATLTKEYGSDILCIVDSAGGMMPGELEDYFKAVKSVCDIPLGFHGHNNLGLAVSHTLHALSLGASIIDTSLQGIGRSAGNAPTEQVLAGLYRMGYDLGIDLLNVMDIGEKYIQPMMRRRGLSSIDIISGYCQFHSSYMSLIRKYSSKYRIDPRKIIIELCKVDKINAPEEVVERIARGVKDTTEDFFSSRFGLADYFGNEQN